MKYLHLAMLAPTLLVLSSASWAADQGSGTLSVAEPELNFGRGPNTGVNPTVDLDLLTCQDPLLACDTYALSVDMPDDLVEFFPGATVRLFLDWEPSTTGADDYDLYLFDAGGNELNSSISSGGPESITVLAEPGATDYGITVAFYLVTDSTYNTAITLDLGEPAADKTDAEVAQWLARHGGSAGRGDELLASCQPPGLTILTDPSGDAGIGPVPLPGTDLEELRVYQTVDAAGEPLMAFELKVDDLSSLTPQTSYFASFETAYGDVRGVRMEVDLQGAVSLFSYVVSEDTDGERQGHFVADGSAVPAHEMSGYTEDGQISIFVRPQDVQLLLPHDTLSGFNAGSIVFLGVEGVGGGSSTTDAMPDGLSRTGEFEYLAQQDCAAGGASSRAALDIRGGAAGWGLLLILALAFARRR